MTLMSLQLRVQVKQMALSPSICVIFPSVAWPLTVYIASILMNSCETLSCATGNDCNQR
jgi:hypothetical protein